MSDREDFDTADLDSAFERFAADVDSHTRVRGAERAIRSAGRRRLVAAGTAFAAAAALAWVLVGALVLPGNQTALPATTATTALPEPRTFDVAALNEATDGWISGWVQGGPPVSTEMMCEPYDGELPEPLDSSTTQFRAGTRAGATLKFDRFENSDQADASAVGQTWFDLCEGDRFDLPDESWSGGDSVCVGARLGDQTFYMFTVVHETGVAVLRVGVTGAAELPESARKGIVLAMLAHLRT